MSDTSATILDVISRAPEWLRRDLLGQDIGARQRAEEALAAMIAAALSIEPPGALEY